MTKASVNSRDQIDVSVFPDMSFWREREEFRARIHEGLCKNSGLSFPTPSKSFADNAEALYERYKELNEDTDGDTAGQLFQEIRMFLENRLLITLSVIQNEISVRKSYRKDDHPNHLKKLQEEEQKTEEIIRFFEALLGQIKKNREFDDIYLGRYDEKKREILEKITLPRKMSTPVPALQLDLPRNKKRERMMQEAKLILEALVPRIEAELKNEPSVLQTPESAELFIQDMLDEIQTGAGTKLRLKMNYDHRDTDFHTSPTDYIGLYNRMINDGIVIESKLDFKCNFVINLRGNFDFKCPRWLGRDVLVIDGDEDIRLTFYGYNQDKVDGNVKSVLDAIHTSRIAETFPDVEKKHKAICGDSILLHLIQKSSIIGNGSDPILQRVHHIRDIYNKRKKIAQYFEELGFHNVMDTIEEAGGISYPINGSIIDFFEELSLVCFQPPKVFKSEKMEGPLEYYYDIGGGHFEAQYTGYDEGKGEFEGLKIFLRRKTTRDEWLEKNMPKDRGFIRRVLSHQGYDIEKIMSSFAYGILGISSIKNAYFEKQQSNNQCMLSFRVGSIDTRVLVSIENNRIHIDVEQPQVVEQDFQKGVKAIVIEALQLGYKKLQQIENEKNS